MKKVFCYLMIFLLLINVFRIVNEAPTIGIRDIVLRFESYRFDLSPLFDLMDSFSPSDGPVDSNDWVGVGNSTSRVEGWVGIGGSSGGSSGGNDGFFDAVADFFESVGRFLTYLSDHFLELLELPFLVLYQVFDFVMWILGFSSVYAS